MMKQNDLAHPFHAVPASPADIGRRLWCLVSLPPGLHWRMFPIPFGKLLATVISLIRLMAG